MSETISGSVGFGTFSYYSSRSMDGIWKKNEDITWAELEPGDGKYDWEKIRLYIFKCNLIFFANYWTK